MRSRVPGMSASTTGTTVLRATEAGAPGWYTPLGVRTPLVLASALMLFLELALIRWTGSNIVHLSYFSNFVLLGSFLGIGIGLLRAGRGERVAVYSPRLPRG